MNTASKPSLRFDPELRHDAESFLREGETLSNFIEHALRASIPSPYSSLALGPNLGSHRYKQKCLPYLNGS